MTDTYRKVIMNIMNFLRYTTHAKAKNLLVDDWFRMGGQIYRVTDVSYMENIKVVSIDFTPFSLPARTPNVFNMHVPYNTKLKIYNQK